MTIPSAAEGLSALVRRRSRELNMSMQALADEAGLTRPYLYKLLKGVTRDPSVHTLYRLSRALRVAPIALFRHYVGMHAADRSDLQTSLIRGVDDPEDAVAFTADVTVPDHTLVFPGEAIHKTWSIQNVGSVPWRGRRLVRVDEEFVVARRVGHRLVPMVDAHLRTITSSIDVPDTQPGQYVELTVDFVAPRENCSVASVWRMKTSDGSYAFPPSFFLQVIVTVVGT